MAGGLRNPFFPLDAIFCPLPNSDAARRCGVLSRSDDKNTRRERLAFSKAGSAADFRLGFSAFDLDPVACFLSRLLWVPLR